MTTEIICDFDGTVARPDTVDELLEALADPAWRGIEERWRRGEIDSRECMARQVPLLRGGWTAIARFLDQRVTVHPSFARFAAWCASRGIALRIASEGIDRVIHHLLAREHIAVASVWASRLAVGSDGTLSLDFSHASGRTYCGAALCKCETFRPSPARALPVRPIRVLIGDGRSDFCAASRADVVFARAMLLDHCRAEQIRCFAFESFDTVRTLIEHSLTTASEREPIPAAPSRSRRQLAETHES
jgi:2,3-diketo-5-methylthio-1-phosphopentane phosphatase